MRGLSALQRPPHEQMMAPDAPAKPFRPIKSIGAFLGYLVKKMDSGSDAQMFAAMGLITLTWAGIIAVLGCIVVWSFMFAMWFGTLICVLYVISAFKYGLRYLKT